jgi:TRAP-type C4-dicarboxylate transport system permease small subunit
MALHISAILQFLIFFLLILEVLFRNFFSTNLFWLEEAIIFFFVWSIYLGAVGLMKSDDHLKIILFKKNLKILKKIINIIFFIMSIYFSTIYTFNSYKVSLTSFNISMMYLVICLPVSFILMFFINLNNK